MSQSLVLTTSSMGMVTLRACWCGGEGRKGDTSTNRTTKPFMCCLANAVTVAFVQSFFADYPVLPSMVRVTGQPVTVAMWVSLCHRTACDSGNVGISVSLDSL